MQLQVLQRNGGAQNRTEAEQNSDQSIKTSEFLTVKLVVLKLHTFTQCFLSHLGPTSSAKVLPEKVSYFLLFSNNTVFFVFKLFGPLFLLLTFLRLTNSCPLLLSKSLGSPLRYSTRSELSSACYRGAVFALSSLLCNFLKLLCNSKDPQGISGNLCCKPESCKVPMAKGGQGLLHHRIYNSVPLLLGKGKLHFGTLEAALQNFRILDFF